MSRKRTITPLTRLEGHGKIHLFLDDDGRVERAQLQIPEFRGFETICEGRAAEELPSLTAKICGICPTAHHLASSKALDSAYGVEPPPAAHRLRELMHQAYVCEDHLLHFFALGVADFLPATRERPGGRNLFGVLQALGPEAGGRFLDTRRRLRELNARIGGSALYPVSGVPGGLTTSLESDDQEWVQGVCALARDCAGECLELFHGEILPGEPFHQWLDEPGLRHPTYYLGTVDARGRMALYDGELCVIDPTGREFVRFPAADYSTHLAERVESDSYGKPTYLRGVGWKGSWAGADNGMFRVGPLARVNVATGVSTPEAQAELERFWAYFGSRPVHDTLAYHWARLIEVLYAAERMVELARDPRLYGPETRTATACRTPAAGVGAVEAPRGTLLHEYRLDRDGFAESVNFLVATQHNVAAIQLSIEAVARRVLGQGDFSEQTLNLLEVALRAYDPCFSCTTHALSGTGTPRIEIHKRGTVLQVHREAFSFRPTILEREAGRTG